MSKKEYSHGEHMAQISKIIVLNDIILMIQKKIIEEQTILDKLDKAENGYKLRTKEYKNVK